MREQVIRKRKDVEKWAMYIGFLVAPLFGVAVFGTSQFVHWRRRKAWETNLGRLEQQYPGLRELHQGLIEEEKLYVAGEREKRLGQE